MTRRGVPNGWAGRKPEIEVIRRNAMTDAERLTDDLVTLRLLNDDSDDDAKARVAITHLIAWMRDKTNTDAFRSSCARTVLPFLLPMPPRIKKPVETAESVLAAMHDAALRVRHKVTARSPTAASLSADHAHVSNPAEGSPVGHNDGTQAPAGKAPAGKARAE